MRALLTSLLAAAVTGALSCSAPPGQGEFPTDDAGTSGVPPDSGTGTDAGRGDAGAEPTPFDAGADAGLPPTDAGAPLDGGDDAGSGKPADAGTTGDAGLDAGGTSTPDAGPPDAGPQVPFAIEGFGRFTVGGWQAGADSVCVASLADSGPNTLREALDTATGPRVITFCLDGVIVLSSALLVPSNVSIDGRGHNITLRNRGLILVGTDDVIITHLSIEDVLSTADDGLRIGDPAGASERVVVDHVTFLAHGSNGDSKKTDEAVSVIFGSKDITLQWVRVVNWEKFLLIGNGDASQAVDSAITVSLHHVWASGTGRRHPQARYGITDLWNCFFDDWHMYDWLLASHFPDSFGVQAQDGARIRFENSLVKRTPHTYDLGSSADDATLCKTGGRIDTIGVVTTSDSTSPLRFGTGCTSGATGWTRPYPVTLEAADPALRTRLQTLTGNVP